MLDIAVNDKLCEFVNGFGEDLDILEHLLHFGRHLDARFNQAAIVHASGTRRFNKTKALRHLVNKGLIVTCEENVTILYMLTRDATRRSLVLDLLEIDQRQWQIIAERILQSYQTL